MMCRDICVLDCCLSWTAQLQRARQSWTGSGQPRPREMFNDKSLQWCWLYSERSIYEDGIILKKKKNVCHALFLYFPHVSLVEGHRKENGQQQSRTRRAKSKQTRP